MKRILLVCSLLFCLVGLGACASGGSEGGGGDAATVQGVAPPAGSKLAKVTLGMDDLQVRKAIGEADGQRAYMTGKGWIPFYYGPDTHRTDWLYQKEGRVVFSRNRWNGALKVIRIDYDPEEDGA
jgi:hypothetical protein